MNSNSPGCTAGTSLRVGTSGALGVSVTTTPSHESDVHLSSSPCSLSTAMVRSNCSGTRLDWGANLVRTILSVSQYLPHPPSPKQRLFLSLTCRDAMYGGSAGCGKSDALLGAALQGINIPEYSAIIFRRTFKDLSQPNALMDRAHQWWDKSDARWCEELKTWTFPSGARIGFGYIAHENDLANYRGPEYQFIGLDEATQFEGRVIQFLFSRLRRKASFPKSFPLRVRLATNPGGIGHDFICSRYGIAQGQGFPPGSPPLVIRREDGSVRRVFVPAHAEDNPGLDWEDYHRSLEELTPIQVKQFRDGMWVQDTSGLVYETAESAEYVDELPRGHEWEYVLAFDIGATNNVALAISAFTRDLPEVYITEVTEPAGLNNAADLGVHLAALNKLYHFSRLVGDHGGLGKGYIDEFRKYFSLPVENVQKTDKRGYIALFNGAVSTGMVRFVRRGTATWTEQATKLLWKNEKRLEEMPGMRNHSCDAVLYSWREARHYTVERRKNAVTLADPIERAEVERLQRAAGDMRRNGMAFPRSMMR